MTRERAEGMAGVAQMAAFGLLVVSAIAMQPWFFLIGAGLYIASGGLLLVSAWEDL